MSPSLPGRLIRLTLLGVAFYYLLWGGEYSAFDLVRLDRARQSEQAELARARLETDSLREVVAKLESDPATLERVARERFGMIRPGEILYRFVAVDSASPPGRPSPGTP